LGDEELPKPLPMDVVVAAKELNEGVARAVNEGAAEEPNDRELLPFLTVCDELNDALASANDE
jgi:hypothetical protein